MLAILLSIFIFFVFTDNCYAYIDPGSMTTLWQLFAAGLIGGLFYIKKIFSWIKGKASSLFGRKHHD